MSRLSRNPTLSWFSVVAVDYPISSPYRSMPGVGQVPAAEVELFYAGRNTRTVGVFDSGAMHTAFSVEWAELLGIDNVREGQAVPITTQAGPTEIFLFQMEMAIIVGAH